MLARLPAALLPWLLLLGAASSLPSTRAAAATPGPPPPPPPNGCGCVDFCAGSCSYNTSSTVPRPGSGGLSLTVMRETPVGVYSLGNKDTADSAGDLAFGIRTLYYNYLCRHEPTYNGCFLNTETVYLRAVLEVDGAFGPYQSCNPLKNESAKSEFRCAPQAWPCTRTLGERCAPRTLTCATRSPIHNR